MTLATGHPTEVLILGGPHLSEATPDGALARTLAHLRGWQPDAVCVELLPGDVVEGYRQQGVTPEVLGVGGYAQALALADLVRSSRPWSQAEASGVARDPQTPSADRVLAWVSALEPLNACRWLSPDLDLPADLLAGLATFSRGSEMRRLALPLARERGHAELHHIDDHTGMEIYERHSAELERLWEDAAFLQELNPLLAGLPDGQAFSDHWAYLQALNSPPTVDHTWALESGLYLRHPWPGPVARARLAQWDTRNLFMAARVRRVSAAAVGGRVLVIVGASHKGPLEAALASLSNDLRMVALEELEG